jgi:hypothetical protein
VYAAFENVPMQKLRGIPVPVKTVSPPAIMHLNKLAVEEELARARENNTPDYVVHLEAVIVRWPGMMKSLPRGAYTD